MDCTWHVRGLYVPLFGGFGEKSQICTCSVRGLYVLGVRGCTWIERPLYVLRSKWKAGEILRFGKLSGGWKPAPAIGLASLRSLGTSLLFIIASLTEKG